MNIYKYYRNLFVQSKKWIMLSVVLFVISGIVGFITYVLHPQLIKEIVDFFQNLAQQGSASDASLAAVIFKQNVTSTLFALVGGVFLAIIPMGIVVSNGFIIGFVVHFLYGVLPANTGFKILIIIVTLLPHGIFELPIVLISAALGMRLGIHFLMPSAKGRRFAIWKEDVRAVVTFIPLLIVVLALAAIIEVFVSGKLAHLFVGRLF